MYFENKLKKHQSDAKKTWQTIRRAIGKNNKKGLNIQSLSVNNLTYTDPLTIANMFNEFFKNVAKNVAESIHPTNSDFTTKPPQNTDFSFNFDSIPLTQTEVIEAIHQIKPKNTADIDGISSNFVKKIASPISFPLYIIFKNSFLTGRVPHQLKDAKIIPLFKS